MEKLITLMKLYSNQVIAILSLINAALAQQEAHWLIVLAVNILGVIVHAILREVPQPEVAAKLASLRRG